jgi:transposase-like protein
MASSPGLRSARSLGAVLNNIIEQHHRRVKQRVYPMLGFKNFRNAAVTIGGIELVQKIRKGQFNITQLASGMKVRMLPVWGALITA